MIGNRKYNDGAAFSDMIKPRLVKIHQNVRYLLETNRHTHTRTQMGSKCYDDT
jgi:hypothetical protein